MQLRSLQLLGSIHLPCIAMQLRDLQLLGSKSLALSSNAVEMFANIRRSVDFSIHLHCVIMQLRGLQLHVLGSNI